MPHKIPIFNGITKSHVNIDDDTVILLSMVVLQDNICQCIIMFVLYYSRAL